MRRWVPGTHPRRMEEDFLHVLLASEATRLATAQAHSPALPLSPGLLTRSPAPEGTSLLLRADIAICRVG